MTKEKVLSIMKEHQVGTLATIRDGKPYSRFMLFQHEDLTLYTATNQHAHKADDLAQTPYVHVLLGLDASNFHEDYVEISAKAHVVEDKEKKKEMWSEKWSKWIPSPEDDDYVLVALKPETILYFEKAGKEPVEIDL
ncbi:pyridoxamine 5'-phosphate oxidase family protein [Mangrovibacillus cuniculi]|uniref:Pyridoxamine 5'-phosphate oxidase family protein n=1 Tax=Mangrovibacillus cuniculi TaxID=2593652 RepID=A0A7S8C9C9_9BACI|nr:pyridoxamine 5'-phosphate oxidase family protein [Mangrovibacillus cuniculi]QPC45762.1 pyridoxamine 5'-phosphate oxidase family protein [Mangrovibacillus cuniculi]